VKRKVERDRAGKGDSIAKGIRNEDFITNTPFFFDYLLGY